MFPNPSISPACYTKYLLIAYHRNGFPLVDAEEGGWIPTFAHAEQLVTEIDPKISFVPFHGFSSMIKSRTLDYIFHPCSPIFNLICSFPHLEDLSVGTLYESYRDDDLHDQLVATPPSSSPAFTGLLDLSVAGGMHRIAYELLSLRWRDVRLLSNTSGLTVMPVCWSRTRVYSGSLAAHLRL